MIHEAVLHRNAETAAEAQVCRKLWRAVLVQALREARGNLVSTGSTRSDWQRDAYIKRARDWIESRDFREVCELAGVALSPQEVLERIDGPLGELLISRTRWSR